MKKNDEGNLDSQKGDVMTFYISYIQILYKTSITAF